MGAVLFVTMTVVAPSLAYRRLYLPPLFFSSRPSKSTRNSLESGTLTLSARRTICIASPEHPTCLVISWQPRSSWASPATSACASCNSTSAHLYDLSCHDSDDFHCRNCLTKTFHVANDDVVRCPHPSCGRPVGFLPLTSLAQEQIVATVSVFGTPQGLRPDNDFFNRECIDKIREQPEVMNNLIAFTSEEAKMILYHICVLEDQVMDPVALGGVPGYMTAEAHNSLQAGFSLNDFVCGLLTEMQTPKLITTPLELEEDLGTLFSKLLHRYTLAYHQDKLARWGIDLSDEDAVLSAALENYKPISELKEN